MHRAVRRELCRDQDVSVTFWRVMISGGFVELQSLKNRAERGGLKMRENWRFENATISRL